MKSGRWTVLACLTAGLAMPSMATAGVFENVLRGLTETGFVFNGDRNFLSGGADLTVSRPFNGQTLDFGATDLTLTGTPTFTFSTGGRGLQVMDISLNTGGNPLNYTLTTDTGNQTVTATGSFNMNATASINSFGFYDLAIDVSSRQTVTESGRFSDETFENDFDLGPIDIRGNLFADLAGAITDPIFQALGVENIFDQFSGAGQFEAKINAETAQLRAKSQLGMPLTAVEIDRLASLAAAAETFGVNAPDVSFLDEALANQSIDGEGNTTSALRGTTPVPEPGTLILLGLAGVTLMAHRRCNRE